MTRAENATLRYQINGDFLEEVMTYKEISDISKTEQYGSGTSNWASWAMTLCAERLASVSVGESYISAMDELASITLSPKYFKHCMSIWYKK